MGLGTHKKIYWDLGLTKRSTGTWGPQEDLLGLGAHKTIYCDLGPTQRSTGTWGPHKDRELRIYGSGGTQDICLGSGPTKTNTGTRPTKRSTGSWGPQEDLLGLWGPQKELPGLGAHKRSMCIWGPQKDPLGLGAHRKTGNFEYVEVGAHQKIHLDWGHTKKIYWGLGPTKRSTGGWGPQRTFWGLGPTKRSTGDLLGFVPTPEASTIMRATPLLGNLSPGGELQVPRLPGLLLREREDAPGRLPAKPAVADHLGWKSRLPGSTPSRVNISTRPVWYVCAYLGRV